MSEFIPGADADTFLKFLRLIHYHPLDFFDKEKYLGFGEFIKEMDGNYNCHGNNIFYLATSPNLFETVVQILLTGNILETVGWKRVVFEKPFGHDLASAKELKVKSWCKI
jgi:glucose-6-phosphate 1-dehydrogenase